MRPLLVLAAVAAICVAQLGMAASARAGTGIKVAIIVGPVGEELTPTYIGLADAAATAAETRGATVATAYSPDATARNVLAAVEGANIVIYFGHGVGSPNPYSAHPNPDTTNGWGLNGPGAHGDHRDSWKDGSLAYYGERWIARHARPAPGWVMIYSNACYAPGAGEGFDVPATPQTAAERVAAYARAPLAELGAAAYFATDFYEGAAHLVGALLDDPSAPFGAVFAREPRYDAAGVTTAANPFVDGTETWLQRSAYFGGKVDYWYAFAGDPARSLAGGPGATLDVAAAATAPLLAIDGLVIGKASSYAGSAGWEGRATVALPVDIGGGIPSGEPAWVTVCADRCVTMPVVDSCPCYVGTPDQRVANLSLAAWAAVTDLPIEEGLVDVEVHLTPIEPLAGRSAA